MKKLVGRNGKRCLSALVALALMAGGVAEARDHQEVFSDGGYKVFDIIYFDADDKGNWVEDIWKKMISDEKCQTFNYHFSDDIKSWMYEAGKQWAEILRLGASNIKSPGQLIVGTANFINAYSYTSSPTNKLENTFINAVQGRVKLDYIDFLDIAELDKHEASEYTVITIGQGVGLELGDGNYGWSGKIVGQLHQKYGTVNLASTMFHEIGHSLGIGCDTRQVADTKEWYVGSDADNLLSYTAHLLDEKGNKAGAGQYIVDPTKVNAEEPEQYFQLTNLLEIADKEEQKKAFSEGKGRAFFNGANVTQALGGKTFWGIDGIPINGWETSGWDDNGHALYKPELSHIELERSLMSHQNYRSYNTFMEAELALLQDIGYTIDRQNFYGKSIYESDLNGEKAVKNSQGFFARNEAGTDYIPEKVNKSTMGVGLHVYGSRNEITQTRGDNKDISADLFACGAGAAGIRVDGVENTVTLAGDTKIEADGQNGTGILVAYGRDHDIHVEGDVFARGDGGDAIRFDFGCGFLPSEYRGSYIRYGVASNATGNGMEYITSLDDMSLKFSRNVLLNVGMTDGSFSDPEHGDLGSKMGSLTVSGSMEGESHAIYIANNAFVDNINIEKGAKITGDITSDWKHFDENLFGVASADRKKLKIQYGTKVHDYDEYCSDLVTDLNVNGDFNYSGNITGTDNMKLKVNQDATMVYTGKADVVSVQVAEEAALYGGSYKVNEITKYASFEPKDDEAGTFINHGTIGPLDENSHMEIEGNLKSDGTLLGQAGGEKGAILVTGKATLDTGSKVSAVRGIHGERIRILETGGGVTGTENVSGLSRALLNYSAALSKDGKSLAAIAKAKKSLAGASAQQAKDYENINNKASHYVGVAGVDNELRCFYALDTDAKALQAIDEIGTNDKGDSTVAIVSAQSSGLNGRVLSSRLATVMGQTPAMRRRGTSSPADDSTDKAGAPVNRPQEPGHSIWARFDRNWGDTAGSSNYTGSTYTMGGDWRHRENQRNGWFVSYTMRSYGHSDGSENLQDTRLGYYTGITKGADTLLLYADFGYLDGSRSRSVSIPTLGTCNVVKGNYTGWLVELGGEWKHALHEPGTTTWQVSPYGALQMSYMKQNGYEETGSMKAYDVSGGDNFYSALEGGVEFGRDMPNGSLNFRLGLNQALCGTNYEAHETGFSGRSYTKSSRVDKTHFITSLAVETELAPNRQLSAELAYQKGAHDKDFMVNVQLKWLW